MSDEVTPDGGADAQTEETTTEETTAEAPEPSDLIPKSEAAKAFAARDAERQKRREAEKRLAEYEAKEKEARQRSMREAENFSELEKELRMEAEAARLEAEEARSALANVHKQSRQEKLLSVLTEKTGQERYVLAGLLAVAEGEGLDVAPEQVDDKSVDTLVRHFKKQAPALFKVESRGGSPGTPGLNLNTKPPNERPMTEKERVQELARKYSRR